MKTLSEDKRKYFKRLDKKTDKCDFCSSAVIKKQAIIKLGGKYWNVLVCKYPYLDGNLMIIPKRHVKDINKLTLNEWEELHSIFKKTQNALSKLFKTKNFNIALNIGKKSGNSLDHLHWQIIPRTKRTSGALDIFADLHIITISPSKLKKLLDK